MGLGVAMDEGDGVVDAGMGVERGLDFAELDPEAADLDLVVFAAEEFNRAVGAIAAEVAGVVEPLAGDRVLNEARRGLGRVAPVPLRQADAADEERASRVDRARTEIGREDLEGLIPERRAVGDAGPLRIDLRRSGSRSTRWTLRSRRRGCRAGRWDRPRGDGREA